MELVAGAVVAAAVLELWQRGPSVVVVQEAGRDRSPVVVRVVVGLGGGM